MRADMPGEGELLEEFLQSLGVFALVRIDFGVRPLKIAGCEYTRRAVARTGNEDHIQVVTLDDAVQVGPDEREGRACAPMAEQASLDVLGGERITQQRIIQQIDHADGKVITSVPPGVHAPQLVGAELASSGSGGG